LKKHLPQSSSTSKINDILISSPGDGERIHILNALNLRNGHFTAPGAGMSSKTEQAHAVSRSLKVPKFLPTDRALLHSVVNRLNGGSGLIKSNKHRLRKQRRIYWNSAHARQGSRNATHRNQTRNSTSSHRNISATTIDADDDTRPKVQFSNIAGWA
jgi:hypothetical protein